jgi:hypothetical protein
MKYHVSDFMADSLFHGLKSLFGDDVVDLHPQWHMYDDVNKSSLINIFHGRGFTLCGTVKASNNIDRTDIENKIKSKYFDLVVYGAVYRNLDLVELVLSHYNKNQIIFIDGHEIKDINDSLVNRGLYFKMTMYEDINNVIPLDFAIPKEKIYYGELQKNKLLGTNIPGIVETLIYNDEKSYYEDYQQSLFGYTWRKACWQSLRHYEIIMNKCVPLFIDIKHCPKQSLQHLPKGMFEEVFNVFEGFDKTLLTKEFIYNNKNAITNFDLNIFNDLTVNYDKYYDINNRLYTYLTNHLTTEHMAKYIIDKTRK